MSNLSANSKHQRLVALDLLKVTAIALMIYDHVIKFLYKMDPQHISQAMWLVFTFTPLSSALFLFLSGYLLNRSLTRGESLPPGYYRKRSFYAFVLIGLSYGMWAIGVTEGHFLSTGILQLLGVLWLLALVLRYGISSPWWYRTTTWLLVPLLYILHQEMQAWSWFVPFVSSHSFSLLPHSIYFLFGMVLGDRSVSQYLDLRVRFLLPAGGVGLLILNLASSPNLYQALISMKIVHGYWVPSSALILHTLLFLTVCGLLISLPGPRAMIITSSLDLIARPVSLIARLSLPIYLAHLVGLWGVEKLM